MQLFEWLQRPSADAGAVLGAKKCRGMEDLFCLPKASWRVALHTWWTTHEAVFAIHSGSSWAVAQAYAAFPERSSAFSGCRELTIHGCLTT